MKDFHEYSKELQPFVRIVRDLKVQRSALLQVAQVSNVKAEVIAETISDLEIVIDKADTEEQNEK